MIAGRQHVVRYSSLEDSLRKAIVLTSAGSNGQQVNVGDLLFVVKPV